MAVEKYCWSIVLSENKVYISQKLRKQINLVKQIVKKIKILTFFIVTRKKATRKAQRNTLVKDGNISSNGKDRKYFK